MSIQINLLPDVKKEFLRAQRQRNLVMSVSIITSVASVAIVIILSAILGGQMIQKAVLTGNINNKKSQIEEAKKSGQLDEYLTIQNQLSKIGTLKQNQPQFSRFFSYINQVNPDNVQINTLHVVSQDSQEGSGVGTISIDGDTDDFSTLDAYKQTLINAQIMYANGEDGDVVTEKLFNKVSVSDYSLTEADNGQKKATFSIVLEYNEAAFQLDTERITVNVPKQTTSDSLRTAPSEQKNADNNDSKKTEGEK